MSSNNLNFFQIFKDEGESLDKILYKKITDVYPHSLFPVRGLGSFVNEARVDQNSDIDSDSELFIKGLDEPFETDLFMSIIEENSSSEFTDTCSATIPNPNDFKHTDIWLCGSEETLKKILKLLKFNQGDFPACTNVPFLFCNLDKFNKMQEHYAICYLFDGTWECQKKNLTLMHEDYLPETSKEISGRISKVILLHSDVVMPNNSIMVFSNIDGEAVEVDEFIKQFIKSLLDSGRLRRLIWFETVSDNISTRQRNLFLRNISKNVPLHIVIYEIRHIIAKTQSTDATSPMYGIVRQGEKYIQNRVTPWVHALV